ncbi:GNAT family N-acetyltransferase [Clostridium sp. MSJ-4]|uniref:GNAT family N-acetyltransferase n=1 Tax=Clostridium simiarum TaxID=2841506 RepID=A0ABS6F3H2_9CLOT|nr:GNAT family N-acetyltransferase [Clostridium simiarum]MBU5593054.1 GNAT family N-acetyltransferase [Clostridium simiarum]
MSFITLDKENIESEHICCAISDKKCKQGYENKKEWLKEQIDKGYVFTKLDERAKVFIEYCPSEIAYLPIDAPNYMVVNCFWVSGKYSGKGYGKQLLHQCIDAAKKDHREGIVVLCSDKKRPYISDKKFFIKHGFSVIDKAYPYFELLYLKLKDSPHDPRFLPSVKEGLCEDNGGFKIYYSDACPFTDYYVNVIQKSIAKDNNCVYESIKLVNREEARLSHCPYTNYSLFYKGKFITHELNPKKFANIINEL